MSSLMNLFQFQEKDFNNRIATNITEEDKKIAKELKFYLLKAMREIIKEYNLSLAPMSIEDVLKSDKRSFDKVFESELRKTEGSNISTKILETFENEGYYLEIDNNGICKIHIEDREIYVEDIELRDLIEKLDIYDKDDDESIYNKLKSIQINIIKNLFLNPSGTIFDLKNLEAISKNSDVPKYYIDLQTDGTFIVDFEGQRHCLPYKFSRHILDMQKVLENRQKFIDAINYEFNFYMKKLKTKKMKYSIFALENLANLKDERNNSVTISFDGKKYYAYNEKTGMQVYLTEKQCNFIKRLSSQAFKFLYKKNKFEVKKDDVTYIDYGTHITMKELMILGFKFKEIKDENGEKRIKITDPFGRSELKSAIEFAKLNMPYTNEMIKYIKNFEGDLDEYYDYMHNVATMEFKQILSKVNKELGKKLSKINYVLGMILNKIDSLSITMKEKREELPQQKIVEEDGTTLIQDTQNRQEILVQSSEKTEELETWADMHYTKKQVGQTIRYTIQIARFFKKQAQKRVKSKMKNMLNIIKAKRNMKKNNGIDIVNSRDFKEAIMVDSEVKPIGIETTGYENDKVVSYEIFKNRYNSYRESIKVDGNLQRNKCSGIDIEQYEMQNEEAEEKQIR